MSYILKEKPEDFMVKELIEFEAQENGRYTYFWLTKRDFSTPEALRRIAKSLHVSLKQISYAGLKDRRAITTQLCAVEGIFPKKIEQIDVDGVQLSFAGFGDRPLGRGRLTGNHFEIVVRNLDDVPSLDFTVKSFPNYFGTQRFIGNNVEIGLLLLQKKFAEAAALIGKDHKIELTDPITTIKRVPRSSLSLYIHSYQSYLFNETLKQIINNKGPVPEQLPLVGFGTDEVPPIMKQILANDSLTPRSFICRQIPLLSAEGGMRKSFTDATNFTSHQESDDLHAEKKKVTLSFDLCSGSYATEFISSLFGK